MADGAFIDKFLAPDQDPLVSYRALRQLTASTRGGRLQATVSAWTTLDPVKGFSYGDRLRRGIVDHPAQSAHRRARSRAEGHRINGRGQRRADAGELRIPRPRGRAG